jgi:hypothetical protein
LTHEVGVELVLLFSDQPLLDVDQTHVDLLKIKRQQNNETLKKASFDFLKGVKGR